MDQCISPLWSSTTWNSWIRSRFSAWRAASARRRHGCRPARRPAAGGRRRSPRTRRGTRACPASAPRLVQPAPRGIDLQERVFDEVPLGHVALAGDYRFVIRSASRRPHPLDGAYHGGDAHRPRLAVLVDVPRGRHAAHRGARRALPGAGHEPRILTPFDPRRSRSARAAPRRAPAAARAARQRRLARAHGRPAGQRRRLERRRSPRGVAAHAPRAARGRLRRRPRARADRAADRLGRGRLARPAARRHLPHLLENRLTNNLGNLSGARRFNRLDVRIAVSRPRRGPASASSAATTA